ncbi:hypothetical protein F5Y03DRAFT_387206 [Xylaria venustula]|nr:hypothetical protein F5Y03DRAFT_387206 [Xylaria venustula]
MASSILYSQVIRRPLSRALPRIPHRSSTWPCGNLDAGRGANATFSFLARVAGNKTDETFVSASDKRPYLSPHIRRSFHASTTKTAPGRRPPPTRTTSIERHDSTETNSSQPIGVKIMKSWNSIRNDTSDDNDSTETDSSKPSTESSTDTSAAIGAKIERLRVQKSKRKLERKIPLSNRVHIIGFGMHARFLAHTLTSTPGVQVDILVHHPKPLRQWGMEDRQLRVPCPQHIYDYRDRYYETPKASDYLDNIIIDTSSQAILPSLAELSHRIDRQTTICLLQPGLGLMEYINECLFPDPLERPNYVLGHSTHKLSQKRSGALYLHWVPRFADPALANSPLSLEGKHQAQHLIELLAEPSFITWKLPWLLFTSAADAICVILGCKYSQIHPNPHAMTMWEDILAESINIVSHIPELQTIPIRGEYYTNPAFRRKMRTYLVAQKHNVSPWVKQVRLGMDLPIDYFNGWLVQRAKELGLGHKYNSMAMKMVKARINARHRYMTDTDTIGGGQPVPDLSDLVPDMYLE